MKQNSRLSSVLHVLLHMVHSDRPLTSDELAAFLQTHAVVVRRTLAGLRELGYVRSDKGHGGGWSIACDLATVTMRDIFQALDAPPLLALGHRTEVPECLVEQAVNDALTQAFEEAEALLVARLGTVTLADLSADFSRRLAARSKKRKPVHGL